MSLSYRIMRRPTRDGSSSARSYGVDDDNHDSKGDLTGRSELSYKSMNSITSRRSNYIWDNVDITLNSTKLHIDTNADAVGGEGDINNGLGSLSISTLGDNTIDMSDTLTYFSVPTYHSPKYRNNSSPSLSRTVGNEEPISPTTSLHSVVDEVKHKVDIMKAELNSKTTKCNDLQAELLRVQTAKIRRIDKYKKIWIDKINELQDDQNSSLHKQKEFYVRLQSDIKSISDKKNEILKKMNDFYNNKESECNTIVNDGKRKRIRVKRQLESDEKLILEKIASSRVESMKKAAADSFGPKLDRMVMNGKEDVRKKSDELESKLIQLKHSLQSEIETKLIECKEKLIEELRGDDEKTRRANERKLEDALRKHSDDISNLKEKFARERKLLDESSERSRRLDAESCLEALRNIRKNEAKYLDEQIVAQQAEMSTLLLTHKDEVTALQRTLRDDEEKWEQQCLKWQQELRGERDERAKAALMMKAAAETGVIIDRISEEIIEERKKIRHSIESSVEEMRIAIHNRLDNMQQSENRSIERAASLRGEVGAFHGQLASIKDAVESKQHTLMSLKGRLSELRLELRQVEHDSDAAETLRNEEMSCKKKQLQKEIEQWSSMERDTVEAMARQDVQIANRKDDTVADNNSELNVIKDKIHTLLNRKEVTLKELRRQLLDLQNKSSAIQDSIDQHRDKRY